ncbi:MAG: N-acetylneuraminate synthase [Gammaproteobacteria bacterium]|nr:N-acetylneuraminate synthase [Gammaproteobacteria bacterium]
MDHIYIIAEAGVNHNGSRELAERLIDAAAKAGADAIKFQTFRAEQLLTASAPKAEYQKNATGDSQYQMIKRLELDETTHKQLKACCDERQIQFLSSPFDISAVRFLARELNVSRIKVPSGEITNAPLLLEIAQTGKPVILSTGMSTLGEIEDALGVLAFGYLRQPHSPDRQSFQQAYASEAGLQALHEKLALLHCTTEYPAPPDSINLRVLDTLKASFKLPVGYSDHSLGISVPIAAAGRGAMLIEKHLTLDRQLPGPDHQASLEPDEFKKMAAAIRQIEQALGSSVKTPERCEWKNREIARKSLVAIKEISKGERFTPDNLGIKRPGTGISPMRYWEYLGQTAQSDYHRDEII